MSARGESAGRPRPLRWLYALVAISLAVLGMAFGGLFFSGPLSLVVPYTIRRDQCEARFRGSTMDELTSCMAGQHRILGAVLASSALLALAGALLLAVFVPLLDYRRLRRAGEVDLPAARERFAALCELHGLTGSRVPRLWVAGPAVRQAFTISVPGRRPTVVLPPGVALDRAGAFDPIVTHELAHVLAGDVSWVSALRGPLWLLIPVAVVAALPFARREGPEGAPVTVVVEAVLLVAAVTVLARALLRLRELDADRFAAAHGGHAYLVGLFDRAAGPARGHFDRAAGPARRLPRPLARHPEPAERALALRGDAATYEGGFAQAAAVGFVAMLAMGAVAALAIEFDPRIYAWGATAIPSLAGAGVLCLLLPSLFRQGARLRIWRPAAGAAVGVVLGAFVSPAVGQTGRPWYPIVYPGRLDLAVVAVGLLAAAVAGVVTLAGSLATLAARDDRPTRRWVGMVAAGLVAFAGIWVVGPIAELLPRPDDLQYWLTYGIAQRIWPVAAVALLPAYLLLSRAQRFPWLVALTTTVIAGAAAVLVDVPADPLRAQQQRWWICALAGVVVLAVVAIAAPSPYAWAQATLAATATTAAVTAVQFLYGRLTGRPDDEWWQLAVAPIWLCYALVLLAPLLVPLAGRRQPAPTRSARFALAGSALLAAGLALAVADAGVPGGTAMDARQRLIAELDTRYAGLRHPITAEQATRVAKSAVLLLPTTTWSGSESGPAGQGIVAPTTTVTGPGCETLVRERFLDAARPHLQATGKSTFTSSRPDTLRGSDLTVTVYSYGADVAESLLVAARDARRACAGFQIGDPPTTINFTVRAGTPPGVGELSWRYDSTMTVPGVLSGSNAYVMVAAGYTVVVVYLSAVLEPLDEQLLQRVAANAEYVILHLP